MYVVGCQECSVPFESHHRSPTCFLPLRLLPFHSVFNRLQFYLRSLAIFGAAVVQFTYKAVAVYHDFEQTCCAATIY